MSNPFEDPDVKAAQSTQVYGDSGAYSYGGGAYNTGPPPPPKMEVTVDSTSSTTKTEPTPVTSNGSVNTNPNSNPRPAEEPNFCVKLFNWVPIQGLGFLGGIAFAVGTLLYVIFGTLEIVEFFINGYLFLFGLMIMCIETPTWKIARRFQLKIFYWAKFLSRMVFRAFFYVFISSLSFSELKQGFYPPAIVGVYIIIIAFFMFVISKTAANKYNRIFNYIAAGRQGDELVGIFTRKFEELDIDNDGKIGGDALRKVCMEAGRELTNAEKFALQSFLDESCNGQVTKEDWVTMFTKYNEQSTKIAWL